MTKNIVVKNDRSIRCGQKDRISCRKRPLISFQKARVKNDHLDQKWQFGSKMTIWVKNDNSGQKWQFGSKMTIWVKNVNSGQNDHLSQKWQFGSKMTIWVKNDHFNQKWQFESKIIILVKNDWIIEWSNKWKKYRIIWCSCVIQHVSKNKIS